MFTKNTILINMSITLTAKIKYRFYVQSADSSS